MKYLLLPMMLFVMHCVTAQSISSSVIGLAGGHAKTPDGITLSWTVGEPIVDPVRSDEILLTQGFQQPNLTVSTGFVDPAFAFGLKTYPNPTSGELIMESDYQEQLHFRMVDVTGKIIKEGKWTNKQVIDVSPFLPGIYAIYFIAEGRMVKSELISKL